MNNGIRPEIRGLQEYTLRHDVCRIKMNQNENPYELPADVKEEVVRKILAMRWSRYPTFVPEEQISMVAAFAGWRPDGTLIGNGSNDLLQLLFMSVLERGKSVVISQPTFTLYKLLAQGLAATVHEVPMTNRFAFDVDRLIDTANRTNASLLVLCSPNNPTGTALGRDDVARILSSTSALVALDEAYVHFSDGSLVSLLADNERLVIFQTFSKALGAAGLRLGYALASPDMVRQLTKMKLPYSVNIFTLVAAEVLISRWPAVKSWLAPIVSERERVRSAMEGLPGITVHPSCANFLLFETAKRKPGEIFQSLLAKGILIRDVSSYPMLERGLRVSIGTPEENVEFLSALREAL